MNNKILILLIFCSALITLSCNKDYIVSEKLTQSDEASTLSKASKQGSVSSRAVGAKQLDGISFFAEAAECDVPSQGAAYAIRMTGSLQGCLYTFIDEFECSPSGTYREIGREYFVGTYNGESGTFWTVYKFEAKYEGCAVDGSYVGLEIKGRCQHPITEGSGTGIFEGVTGRLDMKDDIEAGNYPYIGHLLF